MGEGIAGYEWHDRGEGIEWEHAGEKDEGVRVLGTYVRGNDKRLKDSSESDVRWSDQ